MISAAVVVFVVWHFGWIVHLFREYYLEEYENRYSHNFAVKSNEHKRLGGRPEDFQFVGFSYTFREHLSNCWGGHLAILIFASLVGIWRTVSEIIGLIYPKRFVIFVSSIIGNMFRKVIEDKAAIAVIENKVKNG